MIETRIRAAKEAFYGMGKAWRSSVRMKTKMMVFKGQVIAALLSGLESETLRECDYNKLETCLTGLLRRAIGKAGIHDKDGERRQRSNTWMRNYAKVTCIFMELRIRRLNWLTDILKHTKENI